MKLKSVLRSLDNAALEKIQRFWDLAPPIDPGAPLDHDQLIEYLYPRLQNATHFRVALDKLTQTERNLLSFLAIHGGNMEEKELRKRFFSSSSASIKETIETLAHHSLLFTERWKELPGKPRMVGIPEPFLRLIELPHFWQGHIGSMLRQIPVDHLNHIAIDGLGIKPHGNKRDHLIRQIRSILTDPERLRQHVDTLRENEREILFLLLQRRGVCLYRDLLEAAHNRLPHINRAEAIENLLHHSGLLFQPQNSVSKLDNLLRVPRDIYYIITHHFVRDTRGLSELDSICQVPPEQQPKTIYDSGISILRDLVIFIGYIERHPVRQLGNGGIGRNDLKKILTRLSAHKTIKYAQFLAFYCIGKKYLTPAGGPKSEYWGVSDTFHAQLTNSRAFYLDLFNSWFDTNEWNEEFIDGDCLHTDHNPSHLINIVELRRLVISNLSKIPFDTWIDGPRFIESLLAQIEVRIPHRGSKGRLEKQNRINYLAIESIICESLYWVGLLSLGLRETSHFLELGCRHQAESARAANGSGQSVVSGRLDNHFNFNPRPFLSDAYHFHFQITSLGRSIFSAAQAARGSRSILADAKSDTIALPFRDDMLHFTVLPNLDIVAPPDLNLQKFATLRKFTEIRHIDIMSTLAITHNSVRAGMERGSKGEEILSFLENGCPSGLPETVRHLINECSNRYGELTIGYAGGYIQVDDPALREDLRNNKNLSVWLKHVKGDRLMLLNRSADVQHVAQELKSMGFMPSVDSENVYSTGEGRLRFSLDPGDMAVLFAALRLMVHAEKELDAELTEGKALPLIGALRPASHTGINIDTQADALYKRYEKTFEVALKKKLNAVANKYRKQMREFLSQRAPARERPGYNGANPAEAASDIRKLLRFAIEHDNPVRLNYKRSTSEEIRELVTPESINGDKLFAFSDQQQSFCAYRIRRIVAARMD